MPKKQSPGQKLQAIYDSCNGSWDLASIEVVRVCKTDDELLTYVVASGARYLVRQVSHVKDVLISKAAQRLAASKNFDTSALVDLTRDRIMDLMLSCNQRLGDANKALLKAEEALYTMQGHAALSRAAFFEEVHMKMRGKKTVRQCWSERDLIKLWAKLVTE